MKMVFGQLDNVKLLSLLIYGEARGEGVEGMLGAGSVAMNRARQKGKTLQEIILQPKQFSCFNRDNPNCEVLEELAIKWDEYIKTNRELRQSYWIAKGLIEGYLYSNVGDANHYHTDDVNPPWTKNMTRVKQIRRHIFWWDSAYPKKR